jgi:hypothetical protein
MMVVNLLLKILFDREIINCSKFDSFKKLVDTKISTARRSRAVDKKVKTGQKSSAVRVF